MDGGTLLWFAPYDGIKAIAKKIDELVSLSEKEKTQMGLNNKNYFEDNLTCRKLVDQLDRELMAVKK